MEKHIDEKWNKVLKNGKTYGENYRELQQLDRKYSTALRKKDYKKSEEYRTEMKKLYKVFGPTERPVHVEKPSNKDNRGRYLIVQITKRKCGDKVQPQLQVGRRFFLLGRDKTPTGIDVVILANLQAYNGKNETIPSIRCNAQRFEWKEMTQADAAIEEATYYKPVIDSYVADIMKKGVPETPEEKLHKIVEHDVGLFTEHLTKREQMDISLVPLVIYNISWKYAFMALDCAVRDKVSLIRKLSREVRELSKEYIADVRKDLDFSHYEKLTEQTDKCMAEMSRDLAVLFFSANNEFKRCVPDYPYDEMRTYAIISQLFFSFAVKWNHDEDEYLKEKFPEEKFPPTLLPPSFKKLFPLMEAIAGVGDKFNYLENNIVTSMCVIENRIKQFEFTIEK